MAASKNLQIGVFIPTSVQLLDVSPVDLLGMMDPKYLTACKLPAPLVALGIPSTIRYISHPSSGSFVELTASASLQATNTINDAEVQPGMLDIILVPGPDPSMVFDEKTLSFIKGHAGWENHGKKVDVLSICTGCIILGQSGVLKGKSASGPRAIVPRLRKDFPETKWIDDKRWVQDGNIWSSGGITNGQEMMAAYIRAKFPGPTAEAVLAMADVGSKGIGYTSGKTKENIWWLWQILRAWAMGGKQKKV